MQLKTVYLRFHRGYHVGWRDIRKLVDHITILRFLVYLSHLVNATSIAESIKRGEVVSSALLPLIEFDGKARLLAPYPRLPVIMSKPAKIWSLWITLPALVKTLRFADACARGGYIPAVKEAEKDNCDRSVCDRRLAVVCVDDKGGVVKEEQYCVRGDVVCADDKDCNMLPRLDHEMFSVVVEYRNRIDRLTGAADLYIVKAVITSTKLWLAVGASNSSVLDSCVELIKVGSVLGLGGSRSRGWGAYEVVEAKPVDEDLAVLRDYVGWAKGYNYLLGSMVLDKWIDVSKSFAQKTVVEGYSGPSYNPYILPVVEAMDIGSIVYALNTPKPVIYSITTAAGEATLIFNPLVIHSA